MKREIVAVLGASPNPERFSNRAVRRLREKGHKVIPVNVNCVPVEGLPALKTLGEIQEEVDTVCVYVGPSNIKSSIEEIVKLNPKRVILNPGAESEELKAALNKAGIPCKEACTLVLLSSGEF
ncbi:CoA-binding protein [bacterium]|nr:MAG: CoA-binding protein [bacterium]